jgi:phytoene synthase
VADLFAPSAARRHLFALHAFAAEIARVREVVHEPALGEVRLQWWRDALAAGDGEGHPVAAAVIETMRTHALPPAAFDMLIEGRIFDLYDDSMVTTDDLEAYAGQTASSVLQLAALVLTPGTNPWATEAAGHGGVAETIVGVLSTLAIDAPRAAKYVPETVLEAHGAGRADVAAREATAPVISLLGDLRATARRHLADATAAAARVPAAAAPAFLPFDLLAARLDRMDRNGSRPFTSSEPAQWRRQWIIWRAARRLPRPR